MKKLLSIIFLLTVIAVLAKGAANSINVSGSNGADGDYSTLTGSTGAFAKINKASQAGKTIIIRINSSSLAEPGFIALKQMDWTSLVIYPTATGLKLSGSANKPMIFFTGADNVTIDGRVNRTGSADLSIINTNTGTSAATIAFSSSAQNNTIQYCNLQGSGTGTGRGIIFFTTSSSGTGNDQNIIEHNNITGSPGGRPLYTIYSLGSASADNSGNIIRENNIYDFLNPGIISYGIFLAGNTNSCSILNNSFYETTSFSPAAVVAYNVVRITSGTNYTITGNYIGGSAPKSSGSPWTKSGSDNDFTGIYLNVGTGTASSVQNNVIRNMQWTNTGAADWIGINVAGGDVNIGTDTIGASSGTGSIIFTAGTTGAKMIGITIASANTVNCQNNIIGSITAANATASNATGIYGINISGTGITTINNNIIGSGTPGSIYASSPSTGNPQVVYGIFNSGNGAPAITRNTISNLVNGTTNATALVAGVVNGITSTSGTPAITGNTINDLTIANANTSASNTASVCGIALSAATQKSVSGNTIFNLSNSNSAFTGYVIGIYFAGSNGTNPVNTVSENFIYNLSVASSSSGAKLSGIKISSGSTTYSNNVISLGGNTTSSIYGIFETGATGNNNYLYFNTVVISGNPSSGGSSTFALFNNLNSNIRNFRNNLFVNTRSNSGSASGKHYAIRLAGKTNLTIDYNDYFASGTGAILGFLGTDKTTLAAWRAATAPGDLNSLAIDPILLDPAGITTEEYQVGASLPGIDGTGILTDILVKSRGIPPTMGACEGKVNQWKGSISSVWGLPANWTGGVVPATDESIYFDKNPVRALVMDQDRSVRNIINNQATDRLVTNGYKLTVKGTLNFKNGAQIDASALNSTIEFADTVSQTIPAGSFYNNQVYNLAINKDKNVTLQGTLVLLNAITATSGYLDAFTALPTFVYGGTTAQSLASGTFRGDTIYNLTIDNSAGVTLNSDFTVSNTLTVNSGKALTISSTNELNVPGTIVNSAGTGGLLIKSDITGDGKLFTNSPASGSVELFFTGGIAIPPDIYTYHYFTPPVQTMHIGATIDEVRTNLLLTNFDGFLFAYKEPHAVTSYDSGWVFFDGYPAVGSPEFTELTPDRGYNISLPGNDKMTFKGQINTASNTFNLSYTSTNAEPGWNLVGNPYTCNFDLNGVDGLGTVVPGISNTVYYNNNGGYSYWNVYTNTGSTAGYSDVLPPMTGFFVHATQPGMTLTLPSSSKTHAAADPRSMHKKSLLNTQKASDARRIKLVLSSGTKTDETLVMLFDDATKDYNEHYDAFKLFGKKYNGPSIYSQLNGRKYFMKAVAPSEDEQVVVPLRIILKESGKQKIDITEFENLGGVKVTLRHGDAEIALKPGESYTFTAKAGTYDNFALLFGESNKTLQTDERAIQDLRIWYKNDYLNLKFSGDTGSDNANLIIYDMTGHMVYNNRTISLVPDQVNQVPVPLVRGFYIADVLINNSHYRLKFVVY